MKKRVVVTGLGAVTPLGNQVDTTWSNMINGKSGIDRMSLFNTSTYETQIAGEVKDFTAVEYSQKTKRFLSRASEFGLKAFNESVADAKLREGNYDSEEMGLAMGSGLTYPNIQEMSRVFGNYFDSPSQQPSFFSPIDVLKRSLSTGTALMAEQIGASGPMITINTACASSAHAVGEAFRRIQQDETQCMVAGGYDSMVTYIDVMGFGLLGALSKRNDNPSQASRPFDRHRDGFVIGEGAAIVVLEELESALKRNAKIYGEIAGYSSTMNAYRITDSPADGGACITAMQKALDDGGLIAEEIDYIAVHGTSTPYNDFSETMAIKNAFQNTDNLSISSNKSMIGHLTSAAGGINLLTALLSMRDNLIPPTINYDTPDPKLDLDCVPNVAKTKKIGSALVNAFAFGGTNACLAIKNYEEGVTV